MIMDAINVSAGRVLGLTVTAPWGQLGKSAGPNWHFQKLPPTRSVLLSWLIPARARALALYVSLLCGCATAAISAAWRK